MILRVCVYMCVCVCMYVKEEQRGKRERAPILTYLPTYLPTYLILWAGVLVHTFN